MPRSDQLVYFFHQAGKTDWFSQAILSYNLNLTSSLQAKGYFLFRPVLYFLLGTESRVFGYNFVCWQITGIVLHLVVLWFLLKLLLKINSGRFAIFMTAFFSSLYIGSDMVIWQHINAYMIAAICVLVCLYELYQISITKRSLPSALLKIFIFLLIACFTHESSAVISLLFAGYIIFIQGRTAWRTAALLALPAVLLVFFNLFDLFAHHAHPPVEKFLFPLSHTVKNVIFTLFWWTATGLFPSLFDVFLYNRTIVTLNFPAHFSSGTLAQVIPALFGLGCIFIYCLFIRFGRHSVTWKEKAPFACLLFLIMMTHVLLVDIYRVNVNGLSALEHAPYYSYFFWVYFVILIYYLVDVKRFRDEALWRRLKVMAQAFLLIVILINGVMTFKMNLIRARGFAPLRHVIQDINRFVVLYGKSPDFSFAVDSAVDPALAWVHFEEDRIEKPTYLELLFPDYYSQTSPQYFYTGGYWQKNEDR